MCEPPDDVVGELTPERVVPAKLAAPQYLVLLESIEVRADLVDRANRAVHVRGDVIAHSLPDAAPSGDVEQLRNRELTVRERRVSVAVDRAPRGIGGFVHSRVISVAYRVAAPASCRAGRETCHARAREERPVNRVAGSRGGPWR